MCAQGRQGRVGGHNNHIGPCLCSRNVEDMDNGEGVKDMEDVRDTKDTGGTQNTEDIEDTEDTEDMEVAEDKKEVTFIIV